LNRLLVIQNLNELNWTKIGHLSICGCDTFFVVAFFQKLETQFHISLNKTYIKMVKLSSIVLLALISALLTAALGGPTGSMSMTKSPKICSTKAPGKGKGKGTTKTPGKGKGEGATMAPGKGKGKGATMAPGEGKGKGAKCTSIPTSGPTFTPTMAPTDKK
jgi:hypothetical protein